MGKSHYSALELSQSSARILQLVNSALEILLIMGECADCDCQSVYLLVECRVSILCLEGPDCSLQLVVPSLEFSYSPSILLVLLSERVDLLLDDCSLTVDLDFDLLFGL